MDGITGIPIGDITTDITTTAATIDTGLGLSPLTGAPGTTAIGNRLATQGIENQKAGNQQSSSNRPTDFRTDGSSRVTSICHSTVRRR
jgi:hypothetical protein